MFEQESPLFHLFWPHLSEALADALLMVSDDESHPFVLIQDAVEEAKSTTRTLSLCDEVFLPFLAEKMSVAWRAKQSFDVMVFLSGYGWVDTYVCCGALVGDKQALQLLRQGYLWPLIQQSIKSRFQLSEVECDELQEHVTQRLIMGHDGKGKLTAYNGQGPLHSWLRVLVLRDAIKFVERKRPKDIPTEATLFERISDDQRLPDEDYLRTRYKDAFQEAFELALRDLPSEQKMILSAYYIEQMNISEIGLRLSLHRATVARKLNVIRSSLFATTRQHMARVLALPEEELDSILCLLQSQLDLTLERVLKK